MAIAGTGIQDRVRGWAASSQQPLHTNPRRTQTLGGVSAISTKEHLSNLHEGEALKPKLEVK